MSSLHPGDRIRLVNMPNDPDPIEPGSRGTVLNVTDGPLAQITVQWDNGRTLALIPGVDHFELVGHNDLVDQDRGCPTCGNCSADLLVCGDDQGVVTCTLCDTTFQP